MLPYEYEVPEPSGVREKNSQRSLSIFFIVNKIVTFHMIFLIFEPFLRFLIKFLSKSIGKYRFCVRLWQARSRSSDGVRQNVLAKIISTARENAIPGVLVGIRQHYPE